jgi:hypothetical protein
MSVERTAEGLRVGLKSRGVARFVSAAFLAFWLCIWAVGESIVLAIVVIGGKALLTGRPPEPGRDPLDPGPAVVVGVFLIVWLTMWTIGGIAALGELVRLLWAEDRFAVSMDRLTITWVRGPFRSVRSYEQDTIRRISLVGRHEHLALEDTSRRTVTSGLGSRAERVEAATALRTELHVPEPPPAGTVIPRAWEEVLTPEGERALAPNPSTRRVQARVAGVVTMALAAVTLLLMRESVGRHDLMIPALLFLVFTGSLGAGTVWLARGRSEWRIERQRLTAAQALWIQRARRLRSPTSAARQLH